MTIFQKLHSLTAISAAAILLAALLSGCTTAPEDISTFAPTETNSLPAASTPALLPSPTAAPRVLMPETGGVQETNEYAVIDSSNTALGYFAVKNLISDKKVKMRVTSPDGGIYTYILSPSGKFEFFPLTQGNGEYAVSVYKNLSGDQYALVAGTSFNAKLEDERSPFLYPNQYVWFEPDDEIISLCDTVCKSAKDELDTVSLIYDYVIGSISYDYDKYDTLEDSYLPDLDTIIKEKRGICFDYAALMSAMLRIEGIPAKLIVGYAGELKHAWISVYIKEIGWVNEIIRFDGKTWVRMDPTFAANAQDDSLDSIAAYISDGNNYNDMYYY